jgi:hypothetical protein
MPVVNVQAVWFGERPYIITAGGNRYYKGAPRASSILPTAGFRR